MCMRVWVRVWVRACVRLRCVALRAGGGPPNYRTDGRGEGTAPTEGLLEDVLQEVLDQRSNVVGGYEAHLDVDLSGAAHGTVQQAWRQDRHGVVRGQRRREV